MPAAQNIVVGRADVSIGPWVTNAGAGTLVALGHTSDAGVSLEPGAEGYEVASEQEQGILARVPTILKPVLKFTMMEVLLENYRIAWNQLAAQKTGTTPNFILAIDEPQEAYWQVVFTTKPIRTALAATGPNPGTRTVTAWRAVISGLDAILFQKASPQLLPVSMTLCFDESVSTPLTNGRYFKIVDTAVA